MTTKKDTSGTNIADNAPEGLSLTDAEAKAARHDGAKDAAKDAAKDTYKYLTDGNLPGDPPVNQYPGSDESQQYAYMIDLGLNAFEDLLTKKDSPVTETMAAGLLKLERNGPNRTPYVKALLKKLGKSGKDDLMQIADGGPDYTNAIDNIDDL